MKHGIPPSDHTEPAISREEAFLQPMVRGKALDAGAGQSPASARACELLMTLSLLRVVSRSVYFQA